MNLFEYFKSESLVVLIKFEAKGF